MIRYLKNSEIDAVKWDQCISHAFNGNTYALSWYLDIVHEGWEALVEDDYDRVMPLTTASRFGITYLFQPYFTQQLGVFSTKKLNPQVIQKFINHIPGHIRYIELNLNSFNKIKPDGMKIQMNRNYTLDLIKEYPNSAKKYATNTKRNLKKSLTSELNIAGNVKPESVIELFRANRGKQVQNWKNLHYQKLKRLIYAAMYKGRGLTYGVYTDNNTLCAVAFFLKSNKRLIFLFSGASPEARENGAMTFLIDHVIREFSPSQLVLDFEGSNNLNLARFYSGFGARRVDYPRMVINRLNFPLNLLFKLYKRIRSSF